MRSLRLRSCKRRAHSPLRLHDEARLIIGARASSHNQQTQQQIQRYLGARTLCPRTCQRATPATRRSPVHCTWPSIAPTAVPPHVIRPRLATASPRDISCETLCNRQPLLLTVFPCDTQAKSTERWVSMPCSPTRGRAHSQNDAEHLRSLTPCPVYSSLILYNTTHALRGRAWCALATRRFVRLACHVSTSVPSVCWRPCT